MREFIRLQLKLKWGFNRNNSKKSAIMTAVAALLAIALGLALVWLLTYVLRANLALTPKRLAALYLTVVMFGLFIYAIGLQVSRLYRPGDVHISARFPLTPYKVFLSYLIINYIDLALVSALVTIPVLAVFGIAMHCVTFGFVFGALLGALLMPLIPFALSIFIAIPVMYVSMFLERYDLIRLFFFVLFLAGCFVLYYYILGILANFFIHRNWEEGTLEIWEKILAALDSKYNPAAYLGSIIFFDGYGLGFAVVLGGSVVLSAGGIALARLIYTQVRYNALEGGFGAAKRVTKIDGCGHARAIMRFYAEQILSTRTYLYFYLGVAISTPVMVFFCNRLVDTVGAAQMGQGINFGASMLVLSTFMAMICSFSAAIVSTEGKTFYITKIVPVPFRKQLAIKTAMNAAVSVGALAISAAVLGSLQFVSVTEILILCVVQTFLSFGLVFNGVNLNLANPNLKPKANGEPEEINITVMLLIGLVVAAVFGVLSLLLPRIDAGGTLMTYLLSVALAALYAMVNIFVYYATANKKYQKIEG